MRFSFRFCKCWNLRLLQTCVKQPSGRKVEFDNSKTFRQSQLMKANPLQIFINPALSGYFKKLKVKITNLSDYPCNGMFFI